MIMDVDNIRNNLTADDLPRDAMAEYDKVREILGIVFAGWKNIEDYQEGMIYEH